MVGNTRQRNNPRLMKQEEFDWLKKIEANIDASWDHLKDWEKGYIERLLERFKRYGMNTKISPKQWEVITEISEKIF